LSDGKIPRLPAAVIKKNTKGNIPGRMLPQRDCQSPEETLTAGTRRAATGGAAPARLQAGTDLESDALEIHRHRLNLGQQVFICDKFKFIEFKNLIHVIGFIQNQR